MTLADFNDQLADKLNAEFDLPFLDESDEKRLLYSGVALISLHIPPDLRSVIISAADGLDEHEIELHRDTLITTLAKLIDNKRVPDWIERYGAAALVDAVLVFARRGQAI